MSSALPRIQGSHSSTAIGSNGSAGYVDEWEHNALLLSEPHYRLPSGRWSGGGPFFKCRQRVSHGEQRSVQLRIGFPGQYSTNAVYVAKGCAGIETKKPQEFALLAAANTLRGAEGAKLSPHYALGYQRTRPGNPLASGYQFLHELRSPPHMIGRILWRNYKSVLRRATNPARAAREYVGVMRSQGSEYLNAQFGWKPFIADLRKMYSYMKGVNGALAKLRDENGKRVHRRATLQDDTTTTETVTNYSYPYANVLGAPPTFMSGNTVKRVVRRVKTRVWFSAEWHYFVPEIDTWQWDARARLALFGSIPTPEVLWSVIPWSWAIDWFTNVGTVMSNLSVNAVDNATTNYSFTMRKFVDETEVSCHVFHPASTGYYTWPRVDHTFKSTSSVETKARLGGGDPYGINVSYGSLTDYQKSIIAALGLSRADFRGLRF